MVTKPPVSVLVTALLVRLIAWINELFADGRFLPKEEYQGCHLELKDKKIFTNLLVSLETNTFVLLRTGPPASHNIENS